MNMPVLTASNRIRFVRATSAVDARSPSAAGSAVPSERESRSYSQIRRFAQCPLQWHLARLYSPEFVPASLVFGGAFHAAVEAYYRARRDKESVDADELFAAYDRHWARETGGKGLPVKYTRARRRLLKR